MKNIRGRKRKDGSIVFVNINNHFHLEVTPAGGTGSGYFTLAQSKSALGKTGGLSINNGLGRLFIEAMYYPPAIGSSKNKIMLIKEFLKRSGTVI